MQTMITQQQGEKGWGEPFIWKKCSTSHVCIELNFYNSTFCVCQRRQNYNKNTLTKKRYEESDKSDIQLCKSLQHPPQLLTKASKLDDPLKGQLVFVSRAVLEFEQAEGVWFWGQWKTAGLKRCQIQIPQRFLCKTIKIKKQLSARKCSSINTA